MTTIYRVIHPVEGVGPYTITWGALTDEQHELLWCLHAHDRSESHPGPRDDFKSRPPFTYHYGFESLRQYRAWFSPAERADVRAAGFVLSVWDVPEGAIMRGTYQVAFDSTLARRLRTRDMLDVRLAA